MTVQSRLPLRSLLLHASLTGLAAANPVFEPVNAFVDPPMFPRGEIVRGADGNLYGTSNYGGGYGYGTVYKCTPAGAVTILAHFDGAAGGSLPTGGLVIGPDGNFYGTTERGGANDAGSVFRVTPSGVLTTMASFDGINGSTPNVALTVGPDGSLYGITSKGGTGNTGTAFKMTLAGELTSLASFYHIQDPYNELSKLTLGPNGLFYGTSSHGGAWNGGTAFSMTTSGSLRTLVEFNAGLVGTRPLSGVSLGVDGKLYGSLTVGSYYSMGAVFSIDANDNLNHVASFRYDAGRIPVGSLVQTSDGTLYGTSQGPNTQYTGSVYKVTGGNISPLATFDETTGDRPSAGLVTDGSGNFYGTTQQGGQAGRGSVFKITPTGTLTNLTWFNSETGLNPAGELAPDGAGNYYGTTQRGGPTNKGGVFKMTADGSIVPLANVTGPNGEVPYVGLTRGADGNFYGVTIGGGSANQGTAFRVTPTGEITTLVDFTGPNGAYPSSKLVKGANGNFYGTTLSGGGQGKGTAYMLTPGGAFSVLASFSNTTGFNTGACMTLAGDGNLYGTTIEGGQYGQGTVFRMTAAGAITPLVHFDGNNGYRSMAPLTLGADGKLYGSTANGGNGDLGLIFRMTTTGQFTILHYFNGNDGSQPNSGLVIAPDGNFYATTVTGGSAGFGTVFRMTPAGVVTSVRSFTGPDGNGPMGLTVGTDGNLYGMTSVGGTTAAGQLAGGGQIFRLRFGPSAATAAAGSVTPVSAMLKGVTNTNAQQTLAGFRYGTDPTLATSTAMSAGTFAPDPAPTSFQASISGLTPGVTYYFRAVTGTADHPDTQFGDILSFTTPLPPPDIAVAGPGDVDQTSGSGFIGFAPTTVGQTRDQTVTIRNTVSYAVLSGLTATLSRPDAGQFSITTAPSSALPAGTAGSTTCTVRFTPTTSGPKNATLAITSSDPDESPFLLGLSGWGGTTFAAVINGPGAAPVITNGFIADGIVLAGVTLLAPPVRGTSYTLVDNTGGGPVEGTFTGMPEGTVITTTFGGNTHAFVLSYTGGDGNDIVLAYWDGTGVDPEAGPLEFLFCALDSSRDDRLTLAEWQGIYAKIPTKEAVFPVLDADHDTFLSFVEFKAGTTHRTASKTFSGPVQRTQVFLNVDTSLDNIVSRAEIALMWKPGTAAATIDSFWSRAQGGTGMDFWDWLWAKSLPSFTTYDQARTLRTQRRTVAIQLDANHDNAVSRTEFAHLYPASTKAATIDTAWASANATPKGATPPVSMTVTQFVEASRLPKLAVY